MRTGYFSLFLLAIVLSGCGYIPIDSDIPDRIASFRAQVIPGESSRRDVHDRLGKPFISDEQLGIELYRVASGRDAEVHLAPIPIWVDTEEVIIYAMIIYSADDIVEATSWDVFQRARDSSYGFDDLPELYQRTSFRIARLQADGYIFIAVKEGEGKPRKEVLLAPPSKSHEILYMAPTDSKCAVLFFYPQTAYRLRYFIDRDQVGEMPLIGFYELTWDPDLQFVFSKTVVDQGEHVLKVATSLRPSEFRRKFDCTTGRTVFAYPDLEVVKSEPWGLMRQKKQFEGEIRVDHEPFEENKGWRRLLFYKGTWYGRD
jgi:hypothetical protein